METLKIDCMAETINGEPYEKREYTNDTRTVYEVIKDSLDSVAYAKDEIDEQLSNITNQGSFSNLGSSVVWTPRNGTPWVIEPADVSSAISSNVIGDYIQFANDFDNMVKNILGNDEIVFHSQEYIEDLPHRIVCQFCKELCQILLDEYEKGPVASWDAGSNHIVTSIASTSGHAIKGIRVYGPWHTIARMYDIGVITAKDLGISEEEFNEHISWYKVKEKK